MAAMTDTEDHQAFRAALNREAQRIAATGRVSDAGRRTAQAIAARLAKAMPEMPEMPERWSDASREALLRLAATYWDVAANALAALLLEDVRELLKGC